MIKIGTVAVGNKRYDSMQDALQRYMLDNHISDDDVINLVPNPHNPDYLTIYYKEKEF